MFFVFFSVNYGLICCFSNRGDGVSLCHFKEIDFLLKNILGGIGGPKMDLK